MISRFSPHAFLPTPTSVMRLSPLFGCMFHMGRASPAGCNQLGDGVGAEHMFGRGAVQRHPVSRTTTMDMNAAIHLPVYRCLIFALFATGYLALIDVFFLPLTASLNCFRHHAHLIHHGRGSPSCAVLQLLDCPVSCGRCLPLGLLDFYLVVPVRQHCRGEPG